MVSQVKTFERAVFEVVNRCPTCDGSGYMAYWHGPDPDDVEVEPCSECPSHDVRSAFDSLVIELECAGVDNPMSESFTLAAIVADVCRLLNVDHPARVSTLMGA